MPRTALGRARLASLVDLVSRPLDFEYYPAFLRGQRGRKSFVPKLNSEDHAVYSIFNNEYCLDNPP